LAKLLLVTIPGHDRSFAAAARLRARQLFPGSTAPASRGPERLQTSLRAGYPGVVVRAQESLASRDSDTVVWYAYRDGTAAASMEADRRAQESRERTIEISGRRRELSAAVQGARTTIDRARTITAASERIAQELGERRGKAKGSPARQG
jgi:hypothetical protein